MKYALSVLGHGWLKKLMYRDRGNFRELQIPGGGLMLAALLKSGGAGVAPAELDEPERYEMAAAKRNGETLRQIASLGFTGGNPLIYDNLEADAFIVLDEGFWGVGELPQGKPVLWVSKTALPQPESYLTVKDNCFLLLDAEVFRRAGCDIPSDADAAANAVRSLILSDRRFEYLLGTKAILITFELGGALSFSLQQDEYETALTLTPEGKDSRLLQEVPDAYLLLPAEIAPSFPAALAGGAFPDIAAAERRAALAAAGGYSLSGEISLPRREA